VNDFANVIDNQAENWMNNLATQLKQKSGDELAVVTISRLADYGFATVDEAAVDLFEDWGIGEKGKDNGVLILVAVEDRRWRIEVGYGLEGPIPDARASQLGRSLLPDAFRQGRYGEGLQKLSRELVVMIAQERNLPLSELQADAAAAAPSNPRRNKEKGGGIFSILMFLFFMYLFIRHPRLLLLFMMMGGGRSNNSHWDGGSSFGGGFGGGGSSFGGFGGGRSGGGGASGGW
jgi:uncharacterized protein